MRKSRKEYLEGIKGEIWRLLLYSTFEEQKEILKELEKLTSEIRDRIEKKEGLK